MAGARARRRPRRGPRGPRDRPVPVVGDRGGHPRQRRDPAAPGYRRRPRHRAPRSSGLPAYRGAIRINLSTFSTRDRRVPDPRGRRCLVPRRPRLPGGRHPARPRHPGLGRLRTRSTRARGTPPCLKGVFNFRRRPRCSRWTVWVLYVVPGCLLFSRGASGPQRRGRPAAGTAARLFRPPLTPHLGPTPAPLGPLSKEAPALHGKPARRPDRRDPSSPPAPRTPTVGDANT